MKSFVINIKKYVNMQNKKMLKCSFMQVHNAKGEVYIHHMMEWFSEPTLVCSSNNFYHHLFEILTEMKRMLIISNKPPIKLTFMVWWILDCDLVKTTWNFCWTIKTKLSANGICVFYFCKRNYSLKNIMRCKQFWWWWAKTAVLIVSGLYCIYT